MCRVILENIDSADPATRARVRGRYITASLARTLSPWSGLTPEYRDAIASGDPGAWHVSVDPSGGWREPSWSPTDPTAPELVQRAMDGDR